MQPAEVDSAIQSISGALFAGLGAYSILELFLLYFWRHRFRAREIRMAFLSLLTTAGLLGRDVRNASSWGDRLRYLVMPPGWSPDGLTLTADQRKREAGLERGQGLPLLLGAA